MNKTFELRVKLLEIKEIEEIGNNGFKKREVIGVIEGEYPDYLKFEFTGNKVNVPDDFLVGTYVTVFFNIRGRKVESKRQGDDPMYFTSLSAWKMEA